MRIFKSKLFVVLFIAVSVLVFSRQLLSAATEKMPQEKLFEWVSAGCKHQFCANVFPHLADCITVKQSECEALVTQQLATCLVEIKSRLPDPVDASQSKQIYADATACFEKNMHEELLNNRIIFTPECQKRLS